jgi:hypothetical protein
MIAQHRGVNLLYGRSILGVWAASVLAWADVRAKLVSIDTLSRERIPSIANVNATRSSKPEMK